MSENNSAKFEFKLGQPVIIKSFPEYNFSSTQDILLKAYMQNVPIMIVHEMVYVPKLEKKFNPDTGKQSASNHKYHCFWFSRKDFQFHSSWFYEKELKNFPISLKLAGKENQLKIEELEIGSVIEYRTSRIEAKKYQERNEYNMSIVKKDNNEDIVRLDQPKRYLRLIDFVPPIMSIKSILTEKSPKTYDPKTGDCTNEKSSTLVKCVWFNNILNKYSEELIPIEALTSNDN